MSIGSLDTQLKVKFEQFGVTSNVNTSRSNNMQVYHSAYSAAVKMVFGSKSIKSCSLIKQTGQNNYYALPLFTLPSNVFRIDQTSDGSNPNSRYFLGWILTMLWDNTTNTFNMYNYSFSAWWTGSITYVGAIIEAATPEDDEGQLVGAQEMALVFSGSVNPDPTIG